MSVETFFLQILTIVIVILCFALTLRAIRVSNTALHQFLNHKLNNIMATQAELAQQLNDLGAQLDKVLGEINSEIQKLEDAINNAGQTTPEVDAALASLKAKIQVLDDLNVDTPPQP